MSVFVDQENQNKTKRSQTYHYRICAVQLQKKISLNKKKPKTTGISITESLTTKRMKIIYNA